MAKRLATYVHVTHPEHGTQVFGPEDSVPSWAQRQITNAKAWAAEPPKEPEPAPAPEPAEPNPNQGQ